MIKNNIVFFLFGPNAEFGRPQKSTEWLVAMGGVEVKTEIALLFGFYVVILYFFYGSNYLKCVF